MDLKDVTSNIAHEDNHWLEKHFDEMIHTNPHYKNLSSANRQLVLDLIKKYKEKLRHGIRPSLITIKDDKYHLYQNRLKLKLSSTDLEQINNLLDSFLEQ